MAIIFCTAADEKLKEDADESIAEDASAATDSELDRVISSAAAAVEEFSGAHVGGGESSEEPSENLFSPREGPESAASTAAATSETSAAKPTETAAEQSGIIS